MARLFALVALLASMPAMVNGQHRPFDSLAHALEASSRDTHRVDILNRLSHAYYDYDAQDGLKYAQEALQLARSLDYQRGERQALTLNGYFFFTRGAYREALKFYRQAASPDLDDDELLGYNYILIGNVYRATASYDSALQNYQLAVNVLTEVKSPLQLAFAFRNIARMYLLQWRNEQAREYLDQALTLYRENENGYGMSETLFTLAEVERNLADFNAANEHVRQGCAMAGKVEDKFLMMRCLVSEGGILRQAGEHTQALTKYFEAVGILQSADMASLLASVYADIAEVYRAMGQYEIARRYYTEALKIAEPIGVRYEIARLYVGMSALLRNQGAFAEAHEYAGKAMAIQQDIGNEHGVGVCHNLVGTINYNQGKLDQAIQSLNTALGIRRRLNHREGISGTLYNLSLVYAARNDFQTAVNLQQEALAIEKSVGNTYSMAYSHNRLGSLYTRLRRFPQAESHLEQAQAIADKSKSAGLLMNNNLHWANYFEARHNPTLALAHYKQYLQNRDSVFSDIGAQRLAELQAMYALEKKDQQIRLLNQEKLLNRNEIEIQRARINRQQIIIASAVVGLILVTLLLYIAFRYSTRLKRANREIHEQKEKIQSQSSELIEANLTIAEINKKLETKIEDRTQALSQAYKELDTFFYRSSHDFRRPLTTFLGLAEVAKVTVRDPGALELFEKVRDTASNLDKMLTKLQSISDMGTQQLVYKEVHLKDIFDSICDNFRDEIRRRNVRTSLDVNLKSPFLSYPAMIRIIIENLVENAIQFSGTEKPFIRLRATQSGDCVSIDIQDNGQGIGREYQDQVFDMYFRGNERSKGNGLGLYIVKKAVEKLNGSITFSSIPLVGTTFTVMLPITLGDD